MPSFREGLEFVLSTDASKAVKGFQDTEKSASSMGTTITKVGAATAAAGVAVGLGLVGTVKQFEKAEESANKFQTAVTGMGSKIDTARIKRLASDLQQVSTVTNDQVIAAARWGAVYGLTTDQLEELLRVAVDLAAQTGKSLDSVTKALAKAATGEGYKALGKLGLTFDETAYKADAFGTTIAEATEFAGGAAQKNVDTMSGQLTRLGNNWDDIKEQIGKGANEVFEPLAGAAADFSQKIADSNPALLEFVGHFAAVGSVGATAFGTLASVGGQLANLRDGFSGIGAVAEKALGGIGLRMKDASGGATRFGAAMGQAGKVGGIALGALGVAGAIAGTAIAIDEATKNARELDTALSEVAAARNADQLASAIQRAAESQHGFLADVQEFVSGVDSVDIEGIAIPIRDLGAALKEISADDAAQGLKATDLALQNIRDQLAGTDDEGLRLELEAAVKELEKQKKELEDNVAATKKKAKADEEATTTAEDWGKALAKTQGVLGLVALVTDDATAATKGFADSLEFADTDEQVRSVLDLGEAYKGISFNVSNLPKQFDETKAAMGGYNKEQTAAVEALLDWGDAAKAQLSTLIESKAPYDEVAAKANTYQDSLTKVMRQAGFTDGQINDYLETLGMTPGDVETAIKLSGDAEAKYKLSLYQDDLAALPPEEATWVRALIDQGKYSEAWNAMNSYKTGVDSPVKPFLQLSPRQKAVIDNYYRTGGGSADPGRPVTAVAPMASPMAVPGSAPSTANITINMPPGTPTSRTLSELRRYRRGGGDMSGLIDSIVAVR